ncbi:MAG: TIGR02757 family protein [Acidobacteria bacterium]|nr:TIGR02757 family protein [Acidobacteriota bacterium]
MARSVGRGPGREALLQLKPRLDALYAAYDVEHVVSDPIWVVRRYPEAADREVVAFCAAALAFGRVQSILQSLESLLEVMGPRPARFVQEFEPVRDGRALASLGHRWIRGVDLVALLWVLRQMIARAGSIEGFFAGGHPAEAVTVAEALESFSRRALALDLTAAYGRVPARPGVAYFFSRPSTGGACKRLNLFLRWMVRADRVDVGHWTHVRPSQLVIPLDTHVIRVGRCLRLTRRVTPGWRMAAEITTVLRQLDADDPVRYDFALCHLGMMDACGLGTARRDEHCPLRGACHPVMPRRRRTA